MLNSLVADSKQKLYAETVNKIVIEIYKNRVIKYI